MRVVIFVNGVIADPARVRRWLRDDDFVIAADGGARHALSLGRTPRALVGDLDSLTPDEVAALEAAGAQVERHPVAKDKTDLELALDRALAEGATEILLVGALGGRLDQTLANVLLMAQRPWPVPIRLVDAHEIASVIRGGETLTLAAASGSTVSLLPLSAEVTGITYTGMLYPLDNATLGLGSTRGVSNEVVRHPATVAVGSGIALVIQKIETG
jgi:thiamine pyrophosphokinase